MSLAQRLHADIDDALSYVSVEAQIGGSLVPVIVDYGQQDVFSGEAVAGDIKVTAKTNALAELINGDEIIIDGAVHVVTKSPERIEDGLMSEFMVAVKPTYSYAVPVEPAIPEAP